MADAPRTTRAILLDALGTLVALEPPAPRLRAELAGLGIEVSEAEASDAIAAEILYYRAHLEEGRDERGLAALRSACAECLRSALPPARGVAEASTEELTAALLRALRFRVYDDVAPALSSWRAHGLALVVASNWDVSLHEVLASLGVRPMLDGIVTSAEVGVRKPAPPVFERALALAAVPPSEALHVGDRLQEDVEGARAAGLRAILLRRDGAPGPPGVTTVSRLTDLTLGP